MNSALVELINVGNIYFSQDEFFRTRVKTIFNILNIYQSGYNRSLFLNIYF